MEQTDLLGDILSSSIDISIVATDLQFVITYCNRVGEHLFGCKAGELIGKSVIDIHNSRGVDMAWFDAGIKAVKTTGSFMYAYKQVRGKNIRYIESKVSALHNGDGSQVGYAMTSRDVTDNRIVELALRRHIEIDRFKAEISTRFIKVAADALFDEINATIAMIGRFLSVDRGYVFISEMADVAVEPYVYEWTAHGVKPCLGVVKRMTRRRFPWLMGMVKKGDFFALSSMPQVSSQTEQQALMLMGIKSTVVVPMACGGKVAGFLWFATTTDERAWSEEDIMLIKMAGDIFINAIVRNETQQRLQQLAHFDVLTNIPNRMLFNDRLTQAMEQALRSGKKLAVLFLDLDRFKTINDTLGHDVGDMLLQETAVRLGRCIRRSDTVARMGGDEFAIIINNVSNSVSVTNVAKKIIRALSEPFYINDHECSIGVSIGISIFPTDSDNTVTLLKYADIAMYQVKTHGKNDYRFYCPSMNEKAIRRLGIENLLRKALDRGDGLDVLYQPHVDIYSGQIKGMEGILRWHTPEMGDISPSEFIAVAEEASLTVPLGSWMLREVCRQNRLWTVEGFNHIRMAVKLLGSQFKHRQILDIITKTIKETSIEPANLEIELTEDTLMWDIDESIKALWRLKDEGFNITIDDFGTGHSSLCYLKRFPIDALKMDKTLVQRIVTDADYSAIARAIVAFAHTLNLRVIAEGVETLDQLEFLRTIRCNEVQGAIFSSPVKPDVISQMLAEEKQFNVRNQKRL
ncbi:EAL domain-containing protein [Candidatus Magnetobacterium casense]|uniref:EAL domain-containing protein n=1 Tax=Candidatus Magnetobacterium casense TaxID=1455061 RepID=A0ABS6RWN1_9BACT|nr:EAL domain-containing protein [Candidatus Magnetobacterium casensis]MBV6340434.1 EAL domain-containing protein [Candidatus Magnetobacterium casensis]